jgi:hypothetical protein
MQRKVHSGIIKLFDERIVYSPDKDAPLLIQQHFAEIKSVTSEYSAIYTDGSKDGDRVASAAIVIPHTNLLRSTKMKS